MDFAVAQHKPEGSLLAQMPVDIVVNDKGQMMVMHGADFEDKVSAIEFDQKSGDIFFKYENGDSCSLGMPAPENTRRKMQDVTKAQLLRMNKDKKIAGSKAVPVRHII